jgi:hypothetical protein
MNELLHSLTFISAGAAGALTSAIWEGAVLASVVYVCLRLLPGLSAAARSVVWLNVFVLLILLHFVPMVVPAGAGPGARPVAPIHLDLRWSLGIAVVWAALSLWRAVQFVLGIVHLRRLARRAVPVEVDAAMQALLAGSPGRRATELCVSEEVRRPSVLGFFEPRILVPPALIEGLAPQELRQVVLHEMEHLRRGDDWTNLLQKIGLVLFPLNPVLIWVERRLCAERELACDDRVLRSSAGRKAYALCLTRLAELSLLRRSFSLVLGLWEQRPELIRRVQRIVGQPVRSMGRRPAMAATGSVLAGALGCAIVLAHSPQVVSFLPGHGADAPLASLDPHSVARALGGTPEFVKATMPVRTAPVRQDSVHQPMRRAGLRTARPRRPAAGQLAGFKPVPAPLPALDQNYLDQREMIVLTEVRTFQAPPRVVLAVSSSSRQRGSVGWDSLPSRHKGLTVAMPATFAIVPVPDGWLIIQI